MAMNPIDAILWVAPGDLVANDWNPNRVHKQELRLLEHSLVTTRWIQPLLVNENNVIIDGFHRWMLAQESKKVQALSDPPGRVPVAVLPIPDDEAMAVTVRINRAKGTHVAVDMHTLVARLLTEYGWDEQRVGKEIGATLDEVRTLAQDGIFSLHGIKNWSYSKAWYPVEAKVRPGE